MARTVDEIKSEIADVGYQTQDASDVLDKARDEFHLLLVREGDLTKELLAVLEGQTS